ncbi:CBS domain-containing protein [Streptomyces sp. 21So2-11]|uniref:CBS domain-containing protein n=1 Tax=Streptomyces sp. 21So2-11 TaxID=3144408 RepID=UPI00321A6FB4
MKTRTVGEVMTSEVVQAHRAISFVEVARLLDEHRISGLPVVDGDDKVVGVVSQTDLTRYQAAEDARAGGWAPGAPGTPGMAGPPAEELMSTPAVTVHPEQRIADAARVMERRRIGRLPVVDEEDRLIGIATRRDLLRVFLRTDEEIRREVADEALARAVTLTPGSVNVSVRDGLVTLEGRLGHGSDIPSAVRSAWRVDGVVGVVNRLISSAEDGSHPAENPAPQRN